MIALVHSVDVLGDAAEACLRAEGHEVTHLGSSEQLAKARPDVIVLSCASLPQFLELISIARARVPDAYVCVIASVPDMETVWFLKLGADACLVPPHSRLELLARVEAAVRRIPHRSAVRYGDFVLR